MLTQIFGGISALSGLLGTQSAARRAQAERQQILNRMMLETDSNYIADLGQNSRELYGAAGAGGDAIRALGARMGDSLAGAGVYNASATAGAVGNAQRDQSSALAQMAARLQGDALRRRQVGRDRAYGMQLDALNNNVGQTQADLQGARGGLSSFLGSLVQNNLQTSGANVPRASIPPIVNGTVNQGANLPGNAGLHSGRDWRKLFDFRTTPPIAGYLGR